MDSELIKRAVILFNQQVWCWGRDVLRSGGNWLLEVGFERIEPPADRKSCSCVYALDRPDGSHIVLRGFGVFYGADSRGGVFLPRSRFQPRYTKRATLERPPWSDLDLPKFSPPTDAQRTACASLTLDLIDWIQNYETTILDRLGVEYRQSTLMQWDNGRRPIIPVEEVAPAWRELAHQLTTNTEVLV